MRLFILTFIIVLAGCGEEPEPAPEPCQRPLVEPTLAARATSSQTPQIEVGRDLILFAHIEEQTQVFEVSNVGEGCLRVWPGLVHTTPGREFSEFESWPDELALAPGENAELGVVHTPGDPEPDEGYVELRTNDPRFEGGIVRVELKTTNSPEFE